MIKLIVSDLDGTLVNDKKEFAPDFFDILKKLNEKDIKFTIASGRSQYTLEKVFTPMEKEVYYISDNGGYIKGSGIEKVILPLTREQAQKTVQEALKIEKLQIIMCAKDKAYFVRPDFEYIAEISQYYINYEIVDDYEKINEQILKIAIHDPLGSAKNGYPKIKDKLDKDLIAVVSAPDWLDVMNKDLNKGVALSHLQKHFCISPDETMVFGDFNNDIEMLKEAKYSFAMSNANSTVKASANFVAPSNNEFGVVQMIKNIGENGEGGTF